MDNIISKRSELYKNAPENIKDIYAGEDTGEALRRVADSVGITNRVSYKEFALTVGDIILGLHKKESLGQLLRDRLSLPEEKIKVVENGLKDLMDSIPSTEPVTPNAPIIESPDSKVGGYMPVAAIEEKKKENTPTAAPTPGLKPIRTFADDVSVSRMHGYGAFSNTGSEEKEDEEPIHRSSQDDIIKK